MLKENSIKYDKNSIIDTSRQQMNIKSSFTVEKVSLTTLVSKLRLLLYLDMSKGFKKNCYIEISIYLTIVIITIIFL